MTDDAVLASLAADDAAALERIRATGGDVVVSAKAREKLATAFAAKQAREAEAMRALNPVYQRQQAAEREAAAERQRKAQPPPRLVLRAAHERQGIAEAEVVRLTERARRARDLVDQITARRDGVQAEIAAADAAATARVLEALAAGETAPAPGGSQEVDGLQACEHELAIAAAAYAKLTTELEGARLARQRCVLAVRDAATALLLDHAADLADDIIRTDAELISRRADLDSLARNITNQQRHLAARPPWPAQISKAINGEDHQLIGTRPRPASDWGAIHADLCRDPEANLELDAEAAA
jgi:hypothetical protein